jgi:hypothetical protein
LGEITHCAESLSSGADIAKPARHIYFHERQHCLTSGHGLCMVTGVVGFLTGPVGCHHPLRFRATRPILHLREVAQMTWTKPEAEVVAVTMEVTAYVATL